MPLKTHKQFHSGFTLLEILLVIGIIAILAGIVIVAINPGRQLAQVRNTQRQLNIAEINKALQQYYIDNRSYPPSVTTTLTEICNTGSASSTHNITCTGFTDLSALVPTYLVAIPTDPQATSTTGYMVMKNSQNKIIVYSSEAELNSTISIGNPIPTDGLVSYWSFDGNANDSVGSSNGTLYGDTALTTGVKGVANTAYAFDGSGDYIGIASNLGLGNTNVSISLWAYIPNSNIGAVIIKIGDSGHSNGYDFGVSESVISSGSGNKFVASFDSIRDININSNIGIGWHQLVMTINNVGTPAFYKDGVLIGSFSGANAGSPSNSIFIGGQTRYGASRYFNGSIDNVRIYNRALTADEITNIYNAEKP